MWKPNNLSSGGGSPFFCVSVVIPVILTTVDDPVSKNPALVIVENPILLVFLKLFWISLKSSEIPAPPRLLIASASLTVSDKFKSLRYPWLPNLIAILLNF